MDTVVIRRKTTTSGLPSVTLDGARAGNISRYTANDSAELAKSSKAKDKNLINDIQSRLYKLDFDQVKPGMDVACVTGFRRHIYHKSRPPLDPDTREELKADRLKYPWDYTKDNVYRPKKKSKKSRGAKIKDQMEMIEKGIDPYPEYDPFGIYRPRPKRYHRDVPLVDMDKYHNDHIKFGPVASVIARAHSKVATAVTERDPNSDVEKLLKEICKPLPESEVKNIVPYTGDLYESPYLGEGDYLEGVDKVCIKFKECKEDLAEFNTYIDKFSRPKKPQPPAKAVQSHILVLPGSDMERDLGLDNYGAGEEELLPRSRRGYTTKTVLTSHDKGLGSIGRPPLPKGAAKARSGRTRIDIDLDAPSGPAPMSYSDIRAKAVSVKNKMDKEKVLLDRYLPVTLGVVTNEVPYEVEAMYGELAHR